MAAVSLCLPLYGATLYESNDDFLKRAFGPQSPPPPTKLIWLTGERKSSVRDILGHNYPALRVRYWCQEGRSAWVLEEIGKDLPITVGIVIEQQKIHSVRVMVYRENRGGEVVVPAFVDQFSGLGRGQRSGLSQAVDGISGATLSVRALTHLSAMALFLDLESGCGNGS